MHHPITGFWVRSVGGEPMEVVARKLGEAPVVGRAIAP
jgi:hypothetical protein